MDELGTHGLRCRLSAGRLPRHTAINTIVKMSLARVQIPSTLEPLAGQMAHVQMGLSSLHGKQVAPLFGT